MGLTVHVPLTNMNRRSPTTTDRLVNAGLGAAIGSAFGSSGVLPGAAIGAIWSPVRLSGGKPKKRKSPKKRVSKKRKSPKRRMSRR